MKIIDTHTHYDDEAFDSFDFADTAFTNDVESFIAVGCTIERSRKAVAIAARHNTKATVGIHPCDASDTLKQPAYIALLRGITDSNRGIIAAIGEVGLDYYYDTFADGTPLDKTLQLRILREQLALAAELNLPVVYHLRSDKSVKAGCSANSGAGGVDAIQDALPLIRETTPLIPNAVVHCFSGSAAQAKELVQLGLYISFTGNVTYKNAEATRAAVAAVPLERLMLETDCPYLAPAPLRGKLCHSGMLKHTAAAVADIKNVDTDTLITTCNANARIFFGL